MSVRKTVLIFVVLALLFVVVKTPAALVANVLPLPKGIAYSELEGTLWQGSIRRAMYNRQVLTDIKWQFKPSQLFKGALGYEVSFGKPRQANSISGKGLVTIGVMGKTIEDAIFRMPASHVKPMLPIPMGRINGRVIANIKEFTLGAPVCESTQGDISWNKAGIDMNGSIEFGSIDANLSCEQGKLLAKFDGENNLGLSGQAVIESEKKFGFDGFLKPSANLPAVVHQGLSMVAKMDPQGRYKINL